MQTVNYIPDLYRTLLFSFFKFPFDFSLFKVLFLALSRKNKIISAFPEVFFRGRIFQHFFGIDLRHSLVHRKVRVLGIRSESLKGNDQNDEG